MIRVPTQSGKVRNFFSACSRPGYVWKNKISVWKSIYLFAVPLSRYSGLFFIFSHIFCLVPHFCPFFSFSLVSFLPLSFPLSLPYPLTSSFFVLSLSCPFSFLPCAPCPFIFPLFLLSFDSFLPLLWPSFSPSLCLLFFLPFFLHVWFLPSVIENHLQLFDNLPPPFYIFCISQSSYYCNSYQDCGLYSILV